MIITEKYENLKIPHDNYENNGTHRIPYKKNENHENLEIPTIIIVMNILEFHARSRN